MSTKQSKQQEPTEIVLTPSTNCSALIAELILDHFDIPKRDQNLHLLNGMGHGLGLESTCGGLLGAIFAINHLLNQQASLDEIERAHQEFKDKFIQRFEVTNCPDILELHTDSKEYDSRQTQFCGNLLNKSSNEAVEIINLVTAIINPINYSMNKH